MTLSKPATFSFGVLLPILAFIGYYIFLVSSVGGKGEDLGFVGMGLGFYSLVIIPVLLALDCWVLHFTWGKKFGVFLAGLLLPACVGVSTYIFVYGPNKMVGHHTTIQAGFLVGALLVGIVAIIRKAT